MSLSLLFDFRVDKKNSEIKISRELPGELDLIWNCFTKSEILDQWFAPKPLTTFTKSIDFREGGHWHYAMIDPAGKEYWGYTEYIKIEKHNYYTTFDAFSNENGDVNKDLPRASWIVSFAKKGENTLVEMQITYPSLSDIETVIKMGMEDGMRSTLQKLEELLINQS